MIWRHELKYILDEPAFQQLYHRLRPVLHHDRHAAGEDLSGFAGYRIRSLYFDDAGRSGIFDKLSGVDPRYKYRVRIYNDNDQVIHLEKKAKSGNMTHKTSCRLSRPQVEGLLAGDPDVLHNERLMLASATTASIRGKRRDARLLAQFDAEIHTRLLRPLLLVDYERIPLVWPDGNVRVTFDRHLSAGIYRQDLWDPAGTPLPVLDPGQVVLEVKYDHFLPTFIGGLLQYPGINQSAVSKYVLCAGACRLHSWEDQVT